MAQEQTMARLNDGPTSGKATLSRLQHAFPSFVTTMRKKYDPWTYEEPLLLDQGRIREITSAQKIMAKALQELGSHYPRYAAQLGHPEETRRFLLAISDVPFQPGTFRTDFVIDKQHRLKMIEGTIRYPLNGYFKSVAMNEMRSHDAFARRHGLRQVTYHDALMEKFVQWLDGAEELGIIVGANARGNESEHLPALLEAAGIRCHLQSFEDFVRQPTSSIVAIPHLVELSLAEWLALPETKVRKLLESPLLNDPRVVFLGHDKGFFGLPKQRELVSAFLTPEEIATLDDAFAETHYPGKEPAALDAARARPQEWLLKPRALGKSIDVLAGSLASPKEWDAALSTAQAKDMVLQRWHESQRVRGRIGPNGYDDFFVGTLLFWGEEFLGPGMFRASSHPITNVKDNRMAMHFVSRGERDAVLPWL